MKILHLFILLAVCSTRAIATETPAAASSQQDPAPKASLPPTTFAERLKSAGVEIIAGPAVVPLGKTAEFKLPENWVAIAEKSLDRFFELTQNVRGGKEVGVILMPDNSVLFFDYDDVGYVKDDEKDKLKADELMKTMQENQEAANEDRKSRNWDTMKVVGWATAPHYDAKTNNLKWAIQLSSSQDNFQQVWINESIRLLGRSGVMNVTLVSGSDGFKSAEEISTTALAQNFSYVSGEKYAEFKDGDKIAAYGLTALVLGGGAAVAAKAGLFAQLGVLLGKFWKAIVAGLVALVAIWKKFFNKLTGKNPDGGA